MAFQVALFTQATGSLGAALSFDAASIGGLRSQMCVEEVAADGTVGATLIAWNKYGKKKKRKGIRSRSTAPPPRLQ